MLASSTTGAGRRNTRFRKLAHTLNSPSTTPTPPASLSLYRNSRNITLRLVKSHVSSPGPPLHSMCLFTLRHIHYLSFLDVFIFCLISRHDILFSFGFFFRKGRYQEKLSELVSRKSHSLASSGHVTFQS